jgi:hypothetical protein
VPPGVGGVREVDLAMGTDPAVVEIGNDAALGVVEGRDHAAIVVEVGVRAANATRAVDAAAQAVDAVVVIRSAAAAIIAIAVAVAACAPRPVIRAARRIGQRAEVVIERVILLMITMTCLTL